MYVLQYCYICRANFCCFLWEFHALTHWGRVMQICISKISIIASDNGLSPGRHQAIIWTNAGILLIWLLGTKFSEMLVKIQMFSFKEMYLKMSSEKWRPFCLGLDALITSYLCRDDCFGSSQGLLWSLGSWLVFVYFFSTGFPKTSDLFLLVW